ncbi:MAG: VWA domain-containing protein [Cryobacterium sp.]|nr:VWA domain-containing protein [Oligoflexia bacterium]
MWTRKGLMIFAASAALSSCTQSVPSQFKVMAADDTVEAGYEVKKVTVTNHAQPVDVLWMIDNSASMKPSQTKLRKGLAQFAKKFLRSGTDIQLGVITTDSFVASPLWEKYLATPLYPKQKQTPRTFKPQWGEDYAKLSASDVMKTKGMSSLGGLVSRFESQVTVGTDGIYEEHGFGSVSEFLADNEKSGSAKAHPLFRKGSQRIIIFLSDEDDQSVDASNVGPEPRKLLYKGSYYTGKNKAEADRILPAQFTIDCPTSVVDGKTLEPMSLCMRPGLVTPVDGFKSELDGFFRELDGSGAAGAPNYMVVSIVSKDLKTIESLRAQVKGEITQERGERYIQLADSVANGSFSMDIGAEDYSPILAKIGLEIQNRSVSTEYSPQSTVTLDRVPDTREALVVSILNGGSRITLKPSQYSISGNTLKLTDDALLKSLKPGDRVFVRSQPSTVLPAKKI